MVETTVPVAEPAALTGLSEAEAQRRLDERGPVSSTRTSRSYLSIVRANVVTPFNAILAGFGVVTLLFGDIRDALFLVIITANAGIGIAQEIRAKRTLDRLSLLVAPQARVRRDGAERSVPVADVVVDDVVLVGAGDQVVADGRVLSATDLTLDESILTGESQPAVRAVGDELRSGAFVTEGAGAYGVTATGADSFASRLTGEARSFRHPRSTLERAINRLLYCILGIVIGLGAILVFSLHHRQVGTHEAVATATAGVVSLIPEGLVLLMGVTFAAAAMKMGRRGVLAQQLNAIESLASVDVFCLDKTGTLTESTLRVVEVIAAGDATETDVRNALGAVAAAASSRNITLAAVAQACPAEARPALAEVPFASRRRWSAVALPEGNYYLGAPGRVPAGPLAEIAQERQDQGRRVLALARGSDPLPEHPEDEPPAGIEPLGVVVLAEELRPNVSEAIEFLLNEGIGIKVLSGDSPRTVAAIARDVGIPVDGVHEGSEIPDDPEQLHEFAKHASVIGRISPEGKRAIVQALRDQGHYVAMTGDGVNDVPALKTARLAIAQGNGTQMARAVSDLVLLNGDFATVPPLVSEGRQTLRNLQRVSKLYVTRGALAAFLILAIGTSSEAYPLLPRQLSLAGALTLGIPTFFLALAPSSGPWRPQGFVRAVARFAVPAGVLTGFGIVAGYLFARHNLDLSVAEARTVALTILVACGLYLVLALESEGSRRRSSLVAFMCLVMAAAYVVALAVPQSQRFFDLSGVDARAIATALVASAIAVGALDLSGFTVRWPRSQPTAADSPQLPSGEERS